MRYKLKTVAAMQPPHLDPQPGKFRLTITSIFLATLVIAIWCVLYRFDWTIACLVIAPVTGIAVLIAIQKVRLIFWLPLLLSINCLLVEFIPVWFPPSEFIYGLLAVGTGLIAIVTFAVPKTLSYYNQQENRENVILLGLGNSIVGGCFAGCLIAFPFGVYLTLDLIFSGSQLFELFFYIFVPPAAGAFIGLIVGIPIGFVCDILVGLEFKKRSQYRV